MGEDEAIIFWQDALDAVANGRDEGIRCPYCDRGQVVVTRTGQRCRLECGACRRYIEGQLASS